MNMQDLIDGMGQRMMRERSETQMTLGKLIACLETMPPDSNVYGLTNPHSYRGYYTDLAFEHNCDMVKASDLLAICKDAMGKVFQGYKGGDYVMGALTPVWVAPYGVTGEKLIMLRDGGGIKLANDD